MNYFTTEINLEISKVLALQYCKKYSEAHDSIEKAGYAFHSYIRDSGAHNFTSSDRQSKCVWCERTREGVRYDNLPGKCLNRPSWADKSIKSVIEEECEKFKKLLIKAKTHVPKIIEKEGLNAKTLFKLKSTYGYDLEVIMGIIEISKEVREEYNAEIEKESEFSRSKLKKGIIIAK